MPKLLFNKSGKVALKQFKTVASFTDDISKDVNSFLKESGFPKTAKHSRDVALKSRELAMRFDVNPDTAEIAGWLHDISAVFPSAERANIARELDIEVLPEEDTFPMIVHQKLSVVLASELFGITDTEALRVLLQKIGFCCKKRIFEIS